MFQKKKNDLSFYVATICRAGDEDGSDDTGRSSGLRGAAAVEGVVVVLDSWASLAVDGALRLMIVTAVSLARL